MTQANVVEMFNCFVVDKMPTKPVLDHSLITMGVVTDFPQDTKFKNLARDLFKPINVRTLFGRDERLTASFESLLVKQFLHYVEIYHLNTPGLFELEVEEGKIVKTVLVSAITKDQLVEKVQKLIYTNAPIKNVQAVVDIIKDFKIPFDFDKIENNEIRALVYDPAKHSFAKGDDAVRWLVYKATNNTLVIKNKKTIEAIKAASIPPEFFENNEVVLSEVFNRFKPLILAAKRLDGGHSGAFAKLSTLKVAKRTANGRTNASINKIARLSKKNHKPVHEGVNKRFISTAIELIANNKIERVMKIAEKLSIRDKFKILNLIEYKLKGFKVDVFVIRSGVAHVEPKRPVLDASALNQIKSVLLERLSVDLADLRGKKILLDANVDYGLPVSRKQTLGNLPFGSEISVDGTLSSGVYWENGGGARDIDLSTVDINGNRIGWGYANSMTDRDIVFSGDMTYADPSAMEFYTNQNPKNKPYGLFANIYSGDQNAEAELIVGTSTDKKWIDNCVVREKTKLTGRGSVLGFVVDNKVRVFQLKLNDRIANFGEANPVIKRAMVDYWTVRKLFDTLGIDYAVDRTAGENYDFDLVYSNFSIDKLEAMF